MMFWNRVEVYCGFAMKDFSELRDILASNGIKYDYRLISNNSTFGSGRSRSDIIKSKNATQYYLYVHKKDYDNALFLMHTARKQ